MIAPVGSTARRVALQLLRGTTGEYLSYGLNPTEARERTTEAMELILKAWTEPQPFGWQGRYFQYRTVSVWPRPQSQPHPPTYALGTSAEAGEFAARHRLGTAESQQLPRIARPARVDVHLHGLTGRRGFQRRLQSEVAHGHARAACARAANAPTQRR